MTQCKAYLVRETVIDFINVLQSPNNMLSFCCWKIELSSKMFLHYVTLSKNMQ